VVEIGGLRAGLAAAGPTLEDGLENEHRLWKGRARARRLPARAGRDLWRKNFVALLAEEQLADPSFRAEWQRLAPAREFAATLLRYRDEHKLSQRALAKKLGVSQPRVVKLESGEHNPESTRSSMLSGVWGSSSCWTWHPRAASRHW
jgi:DNA-binding XRE family transcriptional regulator